MTIGPGARALAIACLVLPGLSSAPSVLAFVPAPAEPAPPPVSSPAPGYPLAEKTLYQSLLGNLSISAPQDSIGGGEYRAATGLFEAGLFDSAAVTYQRFALHYPRNLLVNDAIERVLLIRENREPGDEALKLYAHTLRLRTSGLADSAGRSAKAGLERFPKARIRYHWQYLLAEIAHERGDHTGAIRYALVVADSTSKSRLAPYALKLAGDETIAMGEDPAKALRLYQALLERYPASPLAPPVRALVMEIRKRLQL